MKKIVMDTNTIISGDHHLLDLISFKNIQIVTPKKFIDIEMIK